MSTKHILIIDNELIIRDIFAHLLSDNGYDIQSAKSNDEALVFLNQFNFDLILADVHMEGTSFSVFISSLKSNEKFKHIPIVAVTGAPELIDRNDRNQIECVLEKPFTPEALVQNVQLILQ